MLEEIGISAGIGLGRHGKLTILVTTPCFTERQHLLCSMWARRFTDPTTPAGASTELMAVENSIMTVQAGYVSN
jgi:hypothetical protein